MAGIHFIGPSPLSYNPPIPSAEVVTDSLEQYINPQISSTADQSGNGRNVTLQGGLSLDGNNYYALNASGKYINAGWQQTLNAQFTWACWINVKVGGNASVDPNLITNYITSTTPFWFMGLRGSIRADNGSFLWNGRTTTNNEIGGNIEGSDTRGAWHYHALAYDATTGDFEYWLDGTSVNSGTKTGETGNYTSAQNIIVYGGHLTRYFTDALGGAFQLYSKYLSDAEVLQNYNALKADYGL